MKYKAFFIDAHKPEISGVEIGSGLDDMYRLIGCDMVQVATELPNRDLIWVDEEGLLKPLSYAFSVKDSHQDYFSGSGVVVGQDSMGEFENVRSSIEELQAIIRFLYFKQATMRMEPVLSGVA